MNNCLIGNGKINNDNRSQTLTKLVNEAVENSSIELKSRANLILISEINRNTASFINFYNKELASRGIDVNVSSVEDINSKINASRKKEYNNLTRNILVSYIKHLIKDVNNYNSIGLLSNDGFTSSSARELGAEYVATNLLIAIHNNNKKAKKDKLSKESLIKNIHKDIMSEKDIILEKLVARMEALIAEEDKNNTENKTNENKYSSYKKDKDNLDKLFKSYKEAVQKYNTLKKQFGKDAEVTEIQFNITSSLKIAINNYKSYLLNKHGNTVEKNFAAISYNLTNPQFIDRIWSQSKISDYRDTYEDGFNNDFLEEDDILMYEAESIDESTKRWSEESKSNFTNEIATDVKYLLSIIYKMKTPFNGTHNEEGYKQNYDKDNLCGVPTTYDYKYVVTQLVSTCKASSYQDFLDKVYNLAMHNPNNYGFISLWGMMKENTNFGIRIFTQIQKPVIDKTTINAENITDGRNYISNEEADERNSQYYEMVNSIKSNYKGAIEFIDEHKKLLKEIHDAIFPEDTLTAREKALGINKNKTINIGLANDNIVKYMRFYMPYLSEQTIYCALKSINEKDIKLVYGNLIKYLTAINKFVEKQLNAENEKYKKYSEERKEYLKKAEQGDPTAVKPELERVIVDVQQDASINEAIINLAEFIYKFDKNNVSLNSKNAEGSLASDLQNNTYISRILDILKNNNIEGLKNLKTEIDACPQYKYSPLFYGIRDANGEILVHGLFDNDSVDGIDMIGVKMINVTLFDGIIDRTSDTGVTYKKLTKGDYFISKLIKYFDPSISSADSNTNKENVCEVFFNTPSDAPKNYTIRLPRYRFSNGGKKLISVNNDKIEKLLADKLTSYFQNIFLENYEEDAKNILATYITNNSKNKNRKKGSKNISFISDEEFSNLLMNNGKVGVRINETLNANYNDDITYRIVHKNENGYSIIYAKDGNYQKNKNNKNRNFILNNATIVDIVTFDKEGNIVENKAIGRLKSMIVKSNPSIKRNILETNIKSGELNFEVSKDVVMFTAFKQNVKSELSGAINALNALFYKDEEGVYRLKTKESDIINLLDRYHYNETLSKNGKLTGNIFKFGKLFDTSTYKAGSEIEALISLYGEDGIISSDENGLYINTDKILSENNNTVISLNNGKFELNEAYDFNQLDDIISNWLSSFAKDIIRDYQQYRYIIDEALDYGSVSIDRVLEMVLGDVLHNYSTTDLFSGEPKFYKNSRDYLKRAKEVQAGGENYVFYDLNESRNSGVRELNNIDITEDFVDYNGNQLIIKPTNGFKAITIKNTISTITNADNIYKEIYDYNVKKLNELVKKHKEETKETLYTETEIDIIAKSRAKQIASRFGYLSEEDKKNGKKPINTKKNDAQSYITFEEFIKRKMADGTIEEYREIINKIKEIRNIKTPEERQKLIDTFDLSEINARIQVQKNFYYDMAYDKNSGVRYPRQVKNAEFVLIPEFLEGTGLLDLYNIMVENGIDQVNTEETTKATKRNIITFWDNNGKVDIEKFKEQLNSNADIIDTYYYQYLYKQQDVKQHMVDERNKAGIQILRKFIDNMTSETEPFVREFIEHYVANIQESFHELLYSCGWSLNEKGDVVNANGLQISFEEFFKKGKQQAAKLGLNSNFAEYFEIDEITKLPKMPVWMNNVSGKIESISQAIFNSIITRQQLPGWHAAQVTGIGIGKKVKDDKGVYHELQYHPKGKDGNNQPYIEIMLPRWSKLLDGYSIEDIENGKCDIQIIYRMPTEGKQSVAIAKVVGILPDIYGSTVLVPDAWVTQTGSDFDVDTIYAIVYNMMIKDNNIEKVKFDDDTSIEATMKRYVNYVSRLARLKIEKGFYDSTEQLEELNKLNKEIEYIKTELEIIKNTKKDIYTEYNEVTDNIFSITGNKNVKNIIKTAQNQASLNNTDKDGNLNTLSYYRELFNVYDNAILDSTEDLSDEEIKQIQILTETTKRTLDKIEANANVYENFHKNIDEYTELKSKTYEESFNKIKQIASERGIVSFEEFSSWNIIRQNSRKARENVMLDNFIKIMSHPDSREENYYSSNFDDITRANEFVKELRGIDKQSEEVYNPFTQVQYLEDAMSGAAIKAFSVTRDNFASICNKTRATLSSSITVRYHKEYGYNKKEIEGAYDLDVTSTDNVFIVKHNKLSHSKNNRNVVGKICTVYGAETTAHSLDNIKEGSIYNENLFTFGTFKTLVDLGIDYNTSVAWLGLPGIDRVVGAYYNSNSVYLNDSGNPVQEAIKKLAIENSLVGEYSSYSTALQELKNNYSDVAKELGYDLSDKNSINTLDTKLIRDRFNGNLTAEQEVAFDLITILQFSNIHAITTNIEKLVRCTNPDKFGAKQTIRATFETMNNIEKYREHEEVENVKDDAVGSTVLVDGKYLMDVLYPLNENGEIDVENSKYAYLAAILKHSTIPSIDINKQLFEADYLLMVNEMNNPRNQTRIIGRKLTDDEYKQLREYLVHFIYGMDELLCSPVSINVENIKSKKSIKGNIILKSKENTYYWEEEYARIKGFIVDEDNVKINDFENPTQEEIDKFAKLTPSRKLQLIKRYLVDDAGIFSKIGINLFSGQNTRDRIKSGNYTQTLSINLQNENIEDLYKEFNNAISSKNPFVKLTAIDLIKYAFMVEGFRFTRNGITNIITNHSINNNRDGFAINGINNSHDLTLIQSFYNQMQTLISEVDNGKYETIDEMFDRFVRSNNHIIKEDKYLLKLKDGDEKKGIIPDRCTLENNCYYFASTDEYGKKVVDYIRDKYNLNKSIDGENDNVILPDYIKLSFNKKKPIDGKVGYVKATMLFKVYETPNGILLIGVPKLDKGETFNGSLNQENNKDSITGKNYVDPQYADVIAQHIIEEELEDKMFDENGAFIKPKLEKIGVKDLIFVKHKFKANTTYDKENKLIDFTTGSESQQGGVEHLLDVVNEFMESPVKRTNNKFMFYTVNPSLSSLISLDDVKHKNNIFRLPNSELYIKVSRSYEFKQLVRTAKDEKIDIEKASVRIKDVLRTMRKFPNSKGALYNIQIMTKEEVDEYRNGESKLHSATRTIGFREGSTNRRVANSPISGIVTKNEIATALGDIIKDVITRPMNKDDIYLNKIRKFIQHNGIRINEERDLVRYKKQLYDLLKEYYVVKGKEFLSRFENYFNDEDGISIDDNNIHALIEGSDEDFNKFIAFLLNARNFGREFDSFIKFAGSDESINNSIDDITRIIQQVTNNERLIKAIKNIFNEYLATRFSTNPLIQNRLIDITMSFEDISGTDKTFSDIAELNNKEVQLVVKQVEAILDTNTQLDAPVKQKEFSKQYDELIKKGAKIDIIIDSSTGKIIQDFNDKFLQDKEEYTTKVNKAYDDMLIAKTKYYNGDINVDEYENAIINFYRQKLLKNIWVRRNIHQAVVDSYYDEVNENEISVLFNRSEYRDDIAKTFAKYIRLTEELKELTNDKYTFTDEEVTNIKALKLAIRELIYPNIKNNEPFGSNALFEEDLVKNATSSALNNYIKTKSEINQEYFEYITSEEWKVTKDIYYNYIIKYNEEHPDYTIEDKLKDSRYKEAYNWLSVNAKKELNEEASKRLNEAIELIVQSSNNSSYIDGLFVKDNAFDEYGNKDPRKLSKHSIELIKSTVERKNEMVQNNVENRLIKDVPQSSRGFMLNNKFRNLLEPFSNERNIKKQQIVKEINEILIKAVEPNTGNISTELLWNNTTHEDRVKLAKLYKKLNELKSNGTKEDLLRLKKSVSFKTNDEAFLRNKNYATLNLSKDDMVIWNNIFTLMDKETNTREPNRFMFGYLELKPRYEQEFIDKDKTDAINFLNRNTRRVPTSYYYLARNEAIANGEYNEWFEANHYYNKYTNKIEPLTIWTETEIVAGSELYGENPHTYYSGNNEDGFRDLTEEEAKYDYTPTFENKYRQIREEYINTPNGKEYNKYDYNYRTDTGNYNNEDVYRGLSDNAKEATKNLRDLLIRYAREYAFTNQAKAFVNKGFLPRQFVPKHNTAYYVKQVAGFAGLEGGPQQTVDYDIDYIKDALPDQSMYRLIKRENYKKELPLPKKPLNATEAEYEAYYEEVDKIKEENKKIRENNLKIEQAYRSNNWKEVFNQLILRGEDYKARQKAKNLVYLLLEDLKSKNTTNSSKALKQNKQTDKFVRTGSNTTNISNYQQVEQENLYHVVSNWAKRVIYSQYKEPHKLNHAAKVLQNIVSSKYMMLNLPGGIANVATGYNNMFGEMFAGTYFTGKNVLKAEKEYGTGLVDYIRTYMFNTDPKHKSSAIIKLFTIVDYDSILGRESGDSIHDTVKKVRDSLFVFQSGGEHWMQNVALLAMMDSHRVYKYTRRDGKTDWKVGTFNNYVWDIEQQAMRILLKEMEEETGDNTLTQSYDNFINIISKDIEELDKYDSFKKDFNREFIKTMYEGDKSNFAKRYRKKVEELTKNAKKDFETKYTTFYDEFEFEDGILRLKKDSVFRDKTKPISDNDYDIGFADKYKDSVFGAFRNKTKKVNNKIHGVYDKLGAARIESKWWGSLVMQYHKHIYPGLMKRYRGLFNRNYYNETRESIEKGSYTSLIDFLGIEFDGLVKKAKEDAALNDSLVMLSYFKQIFISFVDTFKNLKLNIDTIPQWERQNMRRILGDLLGSILAFSTSLLMYLGSDDDELEDNNFYATCLYLSDRIYSEAIMYTPWGLLTEAKTLLSSPIAATNSITDLLKLGDILWQNLVDEDFNPYYTTGLYKGQNKYWVTIGRNIPIYRIINRISNMNKNNKYYRIGRHSSTKRAKTIADYINGD